MRLIEVLSYSKSYKGRFRLIVNLLSFSESYFKFIKKSLVNKKIFYKKAGYAHPYKFISKLKKKKFFWAKHYCAIFLFRLFRIYVW